MWKQNLGFKLPTSWSLFLQGAPCWKSMDINRTTDLAAPFGKALGLPTRESLLSCSAPGKVKLMAKKSPVSSSTCFLVSGLVTEWPAQHDTTQKRRNCHRKPWKMKMEQRNFLELNTMTPNGNRALVFSQSPEEVIQIQILIDLETKWRNPLQWFFVVKHSKITENLLCSKQQRSRNRSDGLPRQTALASPVSWNERATRACARDSDVEGFRSFRFRKKIGVSWGDFDLWSMLQIRCSCCDIVFSSANTYTSHQTEPTNIIWMTNMFFSNASARAAINSGRLCQSSSWCLHKAQGPLVVRTRSWLIHLGNKRLHKEKKETGTKKVRMRKPTNIKIYQVTRNSKWFLCSLGPVGEILLDSSQSHETPKVHTPRREKKRLALFLKLVGIYDIYIYLCNSPWHISMSTSSVHDQSCK